MAKMFYTMDESKAALGCNEDDLKQFAREGRLREFRDGPRLMFKADQVEQLASEGGAPLRQAVALPEPPVADLEPGGEAQQKMQPLAELVGRRDYLGAQAAISTALINIAKGLEGDTKGTLLELSDYLNQTVRGIEENRRNMQEELNLLASTFDKAANTARTLKISTRSQGGI